MAPHFIDHNWIFDRVSHVEGEDIEVELAVSHKVENDSVHNGPTTTQHRNHIQLSLELSPFMELLDEICNYLIFDLVERVNLHKGFLPNRLDQSNHAQWPHEYEQVQFAFLLVLLGNGFQFRFAGYEENDDLGLRKSILGGISDLDRGIRTHGLELVVELLAWVFRVFVDAEIEPAILEGKGSLVKNLNVESGEDCIFDDLQGHLGDLVEPNGGLQNFGLDILSEHLDLSVIEQGFFFHGKSIPFPFH